MPILTFVSENVLEMREPSPASVGLLERYDKSKYDPSGREKEVIAQVRK